MPVLRFSTLFGAALAVFVSSPVRPPGAVHRAALVSVTVDIPRETIARDQCLTVNAGSDAAYECGDLRVVHALPSTRTRGTTRTPTLVYNSRLAHPYPTVSAIATIVPVPPSAITLSVSASLTVNGQVVATRSYGPLLSVRIVLAFDGLNYPTGLYPYTLTVTHRTTTGTQTGSASGELAIVNRKDSPFGAGWWLAGFEQLAPQQDGSLFWIGGDGSTRRYADLGFVGMHHKWVAMSVDRPDTIALTGDNYVRYLHGGIQVVFTANGWHWQTISPLNIATTFHPDAQGRLSSIEIPGTTQRYTLAYDGNGKVSSIAAPNVGPTRTTLLQVTGGLLATITDPDGRTVGFTHSAAPGFENVISERTSRRTARQLFSYSGVHHLSESKLGLGPLAGDTIRTTFCAGEGVGHVGSNCSTSPFALRVTTIDGPRTDSTDVTSIRIDPFGAPAQITDAHNQVTALTRADSRFPALVTRIVFPDSSERRAGYDDRGNIIADSAMNALGDGRAAVTRFEWDAKWDKPTKVTQPEGNFMEFQYDAMTSNRLFQRDARTASQVDFTYHVGGGGAGLLASVQYPNASGPRARDSLEYDALGNVSIARRGVGTTAEQVTRFTSDTIGRLARTSVDITTGGAQQQRDSTVYDLMDRVIATKSYGFGTPAESLFTTVLYDAEGNRTRLERWSYPDIPVTPIGHIVTRWGYDLADRLVADTAPDGRVESRRLDLAGNVVQVTTRRGHVLDLTYDALNRLTSRTIPAVSYQDTLAGIAAMDNDPYPRRPNSGADYLIGADVASFTYDVMGRIATANNGDARITRTYAPLGLLRTERQELRDVSGSTFSHNYLLQYTHDLNGRRRSVHLPAQLVPAGTRDSIAFAYDALSGELSQVSDPLGNAFAYSYTMRGEPSALAFPGLYTQRWSFDAASNLVTDSVLNLGGTGGARIKSNTPRGTGFTYDQRGKLLGSQDRTGYKDTVNVTYSGLGYVRTHYMSQNGQLDGYQVDARYSTGEQQAYDALGNFATGLTVDTAKFGTDVRTTRWERSHRYSAGVGRLTAEIGVGANKSYVYDPAGNVEYSMRAVSSTTRGEDRFSYYAADVRVRAADYRTRFLGDLQPRHWVFEEYRYDALGRRVWVRSFRECENVEPLSSIEHLECSTSTLRRTVWDGEQELIEIQVPGDESQPPAVLEADNTVFHLPRDAGGMDPNPYFGRVVYVPGMGLDRPVAIVRYNYVDFFFGTPYTDFPPSTWSLFWAERGQLSLAACATGSFACQSSGKDMGFDLPAAWAAYNRPQFVRRVFQGTFTHDKEDAARTVYRRERVYDPASGRFTQEDPIGLAGGINLYGFAGGDPVNFSDPFGLCPEDKPLCMWIKAALMAAGTDIGGMFGGGAGLLAGPGALVASPVGAALGMAAGAGLGATAGELVDLMFFSESKPARGSKSASEYDRHVANRDAAQGRLRDLESQLSKVKGPKAQNPIRELIDRLKKEIKGHDKEIRQKWPGGRPF